MSTEKSQLRQKTRKMLRQISPDEWAERSFRIVQKIAQNKHFQEAENILVYLPMQTEPDILPLLEQFWGEKSFFAWDGKQVVQLLSPKIKMADFPFPVPAKSGPAPEKIDLAILPGLLFDEENQRLGHGTGWCDKFLEGRDFPALGVCLECQVISTLPHEPHDQTFDEVITEK